MIDFTEIDNKLETIHGELIEIIDNLEFEEVCEFTLLNCKETIDYEKLNCKGIYLIEIKNDYRFDNFNLWIEDFRNRWEDPKYIQKFVSNLRKGRIQSQGENFEAWIPLYIGKSKLVKSRISQHIFKELNKPTFALKLNARENMRNEIFRISIIRFSTKKYDWISSVLESTLRNRINPIIGRQ